ncbi:sorting nexin 6 [Cricetulus griseus]
MDSVIGSRPLPRRGLRRGPWLRCRPCDLRCARPALLQPFFPGVVRFWSRGRLLALGGRSNPVLSLLFPGPAAGGVAKIPPAPPRPDFDASREKLQKLGEGEGSMTKEEFTKMKQELEAEYLAIFKKTVAMHEVFLCRVAAHPILRKDLNFHVFLEYNQDLSVRGKNKKEKLEDFFKNMVKSADGVIVSGVKDVDDFFEHERTFLLEYHNRVKDASAKSDRMTRSHKSAADDYNRIGSSLYALGTQDSTDICKFFLKVSELFDKTRKIEARVSADEDLKLSDLLKYYLRESQAAKDLLYRRSRSLVDYENANKALDKARAKNKDVLQAETSQQLCCQKFEKISESAKQGIMEPDKFLMLSND